MCTTPTPTRTPTATPTRTRTPTPPGGSGAADVLHYHLDHLGSTQVITTSTGGVYRHIRYKPYGEVRGGSVCGNDQLCREFTGYDTEPISALEYAGARVYDPALATFLTLDPVRQYHSPYAYVGWNPITRTDPTGMSGPVAQEPETEIVVRPQPDPTMSWNGLPVTGGIGGTLTLTAGQYAAPAPVTLDLAGLGARVATVGARLAAPATGFGIALGAYGLAGLAGEFMLNLAEHVEKVLRVRGGGRRERRALARWQRGGVEAGIGGRKSLLSPSGGLQDCTGSNAEQGGDTSRAGRPAWRTAEYQTSGEKTPTRGAAER